MGKLGSEFIKPFRDYEKTYIGGLPKNILILLFGIMATTILIIWVMFAELPSIFMFIIAIITIPPTYLFGMDKLEEVKKQISFFLTVQERAYISEFDNRKEDKKIGYIQSKSIKETDEI